MKVYNLTQQQLEFHGFSIPPNGGWREVPALDVFASDRDLEMARRGVISFTSLPPLWRPAGLKKIEAAVTAPRPAPPMPEQKVEPKAEPVEERHETKQERRDRWKKGE